MPESCDWRSGHERTRVPAAGWRASRRTAHSDRPMVRPFTCTRCAWAAVLALALALLSACGTTNHRAGPVQAQRPQAAGHAAPTPRPPVIRAGRTIRSFAGTGNRAIGSLSARKPVVLQWSTSGERIQLFTGQGFLLLDSHARAGRLRLVPGNYSRLRVASPARWTLLLRASA